MTTSHADDFASANPDSYFSKVGRGLLRGCEELAEKAFLLYHVMKDPNVPVKARAIAGTALTYLVLPTDAVADVLPIVGLTDDAATLAVAVVTILASVTKEHHAAAKVSLDGFFNRG